MRNRWVMVRSGGFSGLSCRSDPVLAFRGRAGDERPLARAKGRRRAAGKQPSPGLAYRFAKIWPSITYTAEPATVCELYRPNGTPANTESDERTMIICTLNNLGS